ncbi:MAG: lytic transglycosylase domain-containing protein [Saprospiraceae bacterium]|nr:lytic transglycosylase domain-containing protein [Saprospiraceae bacterium]
MKKAFFAYGFLLIVFCFVAVITSYTKGDETSADSTKDLNDRVLPQLVKSVNLNKDYVFAGEALPLDNFDVLQRLDNELTLNAYRHGQTSLNLKKAARYFPIVEPIFKSFGIPDDLKYIAVAESDLENATSPAGAKGFWQFMPAVGKQYGLEINDEIDERYHLEKATEAACKHLASYKRYFGSWTLAVAAYNGGIGRISDVTKGSKRHYFLRLEPQIRKLVVTFFG